MEQYKMKVRKRQRYLIIAFVMALVLGTGLIYYTLTTKLAENHESSFFSGAIVGMTTAIVILFLIYAIRTGRALKNDETLRDMYRCEQDERTKEITAKSSTGTLALQTKLLPLAAIAFGFFNITVAVTLLLVAVIMALIQFAFLTYYNKKY